MSEFYKMEPLAWDRGTDNLTLEQEAAYLRICNAIYAADQAIRENYRVLAGMWRCNERKAKRLLSELIDAGKVAVKDGWITNEKAMNDVSIRNELRVKRQLAGHSGGVQSGKSRAKALESKETAEANASTRKEEEKEKKIIKEPASRADEEFERIWAGYPRKTAKAAAQKAWAKARKSDGFQEISAGLNRYIRSRQGKDHQFTAHLSTWLNQRRWEDEAQAPSGMSNPSGQRGQQAGAFGFIPEHS